MFIPIRLVCSVNMHTHDFRANHEGVSEVSEQTCEWSEESKRIEVERYGASEPSVRRMQMKTVSDHEDC